MTIAELIVELQKRDSETEVYFESSGCSNCANREPLENYHIHDTVVRNGWDFNNKTKNVVLFGNEA